MPRLNSRAQRSRSVCSRKKARPPSSRNSTSIKSRFRIPSFLIPPTRRPPKSRLSKNRLRPLPLLRLQVSRSLSTAARRHILAAAAGIPALVGDPISIEILPELTAHRGKLLSGSPQRGVPVHAATFIRRREIVLETQLTRKPGVLRLITVHEVFHFVWARLGNSARRTWAALLEAEAGARGELGESSSVKKTPECTRDYICESFCDTA